MRSVSLRSVVLLWLSNKMFRNTFIFESFFFFFFFCYLGVHDCFLVPGVQDCRGKLFVLNFHVTES